MLKRIVTPNVRRRRIMAGICAVIVLTTIFFSGILLAAEAGHDCRGHDCPICLEMQNCVANFQLVGSADAFCETPVLGPCRFAVERAPCARRAPATTLLTLDVRFDE